MIHNHPVEHEDGPAPIGIQEIWKSEDVALCQMPSQESLFYDETIQTLSDMLRVTLNQQVQVLNKSFSEIPPAKSGSTAIRP
jgi:hypothetical protein